MLRSVLEYRAEHQVRIGNGKSRDHSWGSSFLIQVKNEVAWTGEAQ